MLTLARERLGPEVLLRRMTLPDFAVEGIFDAAVYTFDGLNYLTPDQLRLTLAAVAGSLRPAGWLVFDLHTDAMMSFTIANPVVAGHSAGNDFTISSVVDPGARTCDTRIELRRPRDGEPFSEQHRQYFHATAECVPPSEDAGFEVTAVEEEYTHEPADASTLRATWTSRRFVDLIPVTQRNCRTTSRDDLVRLSFMLINRSAPPVTVTPLLVYEGVRAAAAWLEFSVRFGSGYGLVTGAALSYASARTVLSWFADAVLMGSATAATVRRTWSRCVYRTLTLASLEHLIAGARVVEELTTSD